MSTAPTPAPRRPAADLIDAVVANMRANVETLRYSMIAPSRYTVYLSQEEFDRLQGLFPRLRIEAGRALDEELARLNRRARARPRALERLFGTVRPIEHAGAGWHIEFLPDVDGELRHDQDIIVASELVLPNDQVISGERTRRVTSRGGTTEATRSVERPAAPATSTLARARLSYEDARGRHHHDLVRDSTTIGRGGVRYPVDVRVAGSEDVSREHARIRRDPSAGRFYLIDLSTRGTTVDGVIAPRGFEERDGRKRETGAEVPLPHGARIGLAGVTFLDFEVLA